MIILETLHKKYKTENPETKITKTLFFRLWQGYILPVLFASHKTCLCQRHQKALGTK